jgi:hypothetical protein
MDERTLRELELAHVTRLYGWAQRAVEKVAQAPAHALRDVSTLDWDALQDAVRTCTQCGLCEKRKQAVFGVGSRSGPWMFVGEGPGADEDELGDPFVGQAGIGVGHALLVACVWVVDEKGRLNRQVWSFGGPTRYADDRRCHCRRRTCHLVSPPTSPSARVRPARSLSPFPPTRDT